MPDIGTIGSSSGVLAAPVARPGLDNGARGATPAQSSSVGEQRRPEDRVELSEHARALDALRSMPDVRMDKVNEIRAAIAAGTYETDGKLAIAVERLVREIGG
jgi:negative regulator of flagellin synthesis FlgM